MLDIKWSPEVVLEAQSQIAVSIFEYVVVRSDCSGQFQWFSK